MSEFILDCGSDEAVHRFNAASSFVQGFIEALFFTEEENLQEPTVDQLSEEAWIKITADCDLFEKEAEKSLNLAYDYCPNEYGAERAGRDFWYTRNGHGTGFWDRNLGPVGDELTKQAKTFSELSPYLGDDGQVYF